MQTPEEFAWEVLASDDFVLTPHEVLTDLVRARDAEVRAEALSVFRVVYTLAWDGEPSMSGEPHRMSAGELCLADARRSLDFVGRRKDNPRIEGRMVGPWEPMP